jgi:membrane protein
MSAPRRPQPRGSGLAARLLQRALEFFSHSIWELELGQLSRARAGLYKLARVVYLAARGFVQDRCLVRAGALTYITILSIVPLLAFGFSIAKGMGFYQNLRTQQVDPFVERVFGEAGGQGQGLRDAIDGLLDKVDQANSGVVGSLAMVVVIYTVLKLLSTIESTFNEIWGVTRARSLWRKVSDYVSMVTVAPILLFLGAVFATFARHNAVVEHLGLGPVLAGLIRLSSLFVVWMGFAFLYVAMPNTRVRFTSAALGALVAGLLWLLVQFAYVQLQVGIARYNEIYAGLAALPIFMVWVNVCWIVVLVGGETAFAHQSEPTYREVERPHPTSQAYRRVVALRCAARIARRFATGGDPPTARELALELGIPVRPVQEVLGGLERSGVLAGIDQEDDVAYLPARPLDRITIGTVLEALRGELDPDDVRVKAPIDARLDELLAALASELEASPHNCSLQELAALPDRAPEEPQRELAPSGESSARSATT